MSQLASGPGPASRRGGAAARRAEASAAASGVAHPGLLRRLGQGEDQIARHPARGAPGTGPGATNLTARVHGQFMRRNGCGW